ncbi:MAG: zinc-dependent metalloprotease, partial [Thermoanaerobaculia bacterium]|nr:zinc-dependent metalloprotease [Thermoanaerobaculia bacterium]
MRALSTLVLLTVALPSWASNPAPARMLSATDAEVAADLRATPTGDRIRLTDLLPGGAVELERVPVFTPDAQIVLHYESGDQIVSPPDTAFFRGWTDDTSGGLVTLSITESGEVRGIARTSEGFSIILDGGREGVGLDAYEVSRPGPFGGFDCANADLSDPRPEQAFANAFDRLAGSTTTASTPSAVLGTPHTARIAIETDNEFLALAAFGGNTTTATNYITGLFNYSSGIFSAEIDTTLLISSISYWMGTDPFSQTSASCMLFEYGRYWNDNNVGIDRTLSHMLSGKPTNSGVAWVGVLCGGPFNTDITGNGCTGLTPATDNYGGAYGVTAGIDANFNPGNPTVLWDIFGTIHEVGHNFNSPHTHCYAGLEGNANPIDTCYAGQCS